MNLRGVVEVCDIASWRGLVLHIHRRRGYHLVLADYRHSSSACIHQGVGFGGLGIHSGCIVEAVGILSLLLLVYGGLEAGCFPGAHSLLL